MVGLVARAFDCTHADARILLSVFGIPAVILAIVYI